MSQITTVTDGTQTATITQSALYPILYSNDTILRTAILRIKQLHAAEPIDTVVFETDVAPYVNKLTVLLLDARVAKYRFENPDSETELFIIEFTGAAWAEDSLDLLNSLKNGILELNDVYPLTGSDTFSWASI